MFRHCGTVQKSQFKNFFGNIFHVHKGSPFIIFIFCNQLEFHKAWRVPLFQFWALDMVLTLAVLGLLFHIVYLRYNTVMIVNIRQYFVDLCYPTDFPGVPFLFVFFRGQIFQIVCFSWIAMRFAAAYPCEESYFLAIVVFYCFCRPVVFGCPVLLPIESTIVCCWCFQLLPVLSCLDFLDWFLFYFFVFCQCGWYGRLFVSSVVTVLGDVFYGRVQIHCFFTDEFLPEFVVGNACYKFRYR